jgi:hypothetical protein
LPPAPGLLEYKMKRFLIVACATFASAAAAQQATGVPLQLRPGLWEVTRTIENLPIGLRGMAAERRQQMAEAVRRNDPPRVIRQEWQGCLSAEDLQQAFSPAEEPQCRNTVLRSGAALLEVEIQCEAAGGRPRRDGRFTLMAESPEKVRGELDLDVGDGAQASTLTMQVSARWLHGDCASAASPPAQPKK